MNNPQPKISDYAVIGDGRTAALVSKTGSIDWCCFPIFDSPSCFARLLDSDGGFFCIRPVGSFESTQSYLDDTNVLETRFRTDEGAARLIDAFPVTSETEKKNRLVPDHEILRIVEGLEGIVRFRIHYAPRPHYGKPGTSARFGPWKRFGFSCSYDDNLLLLQSSIDYNRFRRTDRDAYSEFEVRAGERVIFSLTYAREAPAVIPAL